MKHLLGLVMMFAIACVTNNGPLDPSSGTCVGGNDCVCPNNEDCTHTCTPDAAECHVQGTGSPVDVTCNANAECHVECHDSPTCDVACGGSAECHVTCPPTGCRVTDCIGSACVVSCGATGVASRNGSTATCP